MIVRGWHIDGFGIFHDWRSAELGPGLTVIQGPNEAGKSTLLAFIRGVLFGFPDKRSKSREPLYAPLKGGRSGGRLFLEDGDHRLTVERRAGGRSAAVLTDDAGASVPDGDLARFLGGADGTLFRNVFGFSLSELQEAGSLTEDSVRDRIFSGAIAGAGRSARKAAEDLEAAATRLYRPDARHRSNRVAELHGQLGEIEAELRTARQDARDYPAKLQAERDALDALDRVRGELAEQRARHGRLAALLKLWPDWCEREDALASLEAQSGARFERTRAIRPDPALAELHRQADELRQSLELQRQRQHQATELRATLAEQAERIDRAVATLGAGWDRDRVDAFRMPIPTREEVRGWETGLNDRGAAAAKAEDRAAETQQHVGEADARHRTLARELEAFEAPPPTLETLQGRQSALEGLQAQVSEHESKRQAAAHVRELAQERGKRVADLRARTPGRLGYVIAAGAGLAAAGGGVAHGRFPVELVGAGVAVVLLCAAVLAWATWWRRRTWAARIAQAESDRQAAETEAGSRDAACDEVRGAAETAARDLGFESLPGEADLARAATRLAHDLDRRRLIDAKARELRDAKAELDRRVTDRDAADEALEQARGAQGETAEFWAAWKAERGFPGHLTPQGVLDFAAEVREAQAALQETRGGEAKLAELHRDIAAWDAAAREVLRARGGDPTLEGEALLVAFNAAAAGLADERELYRRIAGSEDALAREAGGDSERLETLRRTLAEGRADAWQAERDETERALAQTQEAYEEAVRAHQAAETARREVERSERIADLEIRRNALAAEIDRLYRDWQVNTAARTLIEETLERFQRERQPAVVARAGERLGRVTQGRYRQVVQDDEGQGVYVVDADGRRVAPLDLSRGTREQLYLAVRLGLIEEFAQRGTSLPLIMDEILVNFDPERMAAVAAELGNFARDHQILLFTCHPEIAERVAKHADATVLPMAEA